MAKHEKHTRMCMYMRITQKGPAMHPCRAALLDAGGNEGYVPPSVACGQRGRYTMVVSDDPMMNGDIVRPCRPAHPGPMDLYNILRTRVIVMAEHAHNRAYPTPSTLAVIVALSNGMSCHSYAHLSSPALGPAQAQDRDCSQPGPLPTPLTQRQRATAAPPCRRSAGC